MSACPQCGTVAKPTDKFCNVCGTPLARTGGQPAQAAPPAPPGYGAPAPAPYAAPPVVPAPAPAGYGAPAPGYGAPGQPPMARCPMGHEIAPGANYCAQGHPIALDQMQFASDAYGGAAAACAAPAGPPQGFAPPQASPYGAPPAAPPPQAFGAPPGPPGAPGYAQGPYAPPTAPSAFSPPGPPLPYGSAPPAAPMPAPAPAPAPAPYAGQNDTSRDAASPKVLRGFLVAYGSNPGGDFWPLTDGRLVVGRQGADGLDVPLQHPTISSRHAALVVDGIGGGIAVEDMGSTNGTFVNDEHIGFNGRRDLRDGDRIRFGGYSTIVKIIGRI